MPRPPESKDEWVGLNRREPTQMTKLIEETVKGAVESHEAKVKLHLDGRFDELKGIMLSAFPDGDPIGHRQFHQIQIDYMNERRQLWKDIRSKGIIGLLWLVLGLVGTAVWEYLKREAVK